MNPVTKFAAITLAAIVALIAVATMEGPSETQAAIDSAANLQALQASMQARPDLLQALQDTQPGTAQHHAAATAFCRHNQGPNAQLAQLPDGTLVCRGNKVLALAQPGGAL